MNIIQRLRCAVYGATLGQLADELIDRVRFEIIKKLDIVDDRMLESSRILGDISISTQRIVRLLEKTYPIGSKPRIEKKFDVYYPEILYRADAINGNVFRLLINGTIIADFIPAGGSILLRGPDLSSVPGIFISPNMSGICYQTDQPDGELKITFARHVIEDPAEFERVYARVIKGY